MNRGAILYTKRNNITGFVVVLALHFLGLYGLWSYQVIPPPSEALTVFVNFVNPYVAIKHTEAEAPKPALPIPTRQETRKVVQPVTERLLVSAAPVHSPAEPVAPPPPVVAAPPGKVTTNSSGNSGTVNIPRAQSGDASGQQPLLLSGELSVSCSERTAPVYPKQSLRLGEQGKSVLLVELDELGRVANVTVKIRSGFQRLDEAAISAVKSWRCTPAKRNGIAVRSVAVQPFNFILKGR